MPPEFAIALNAHPRVIVLENVCWAEKELPAGILFYSNRLPAP
jgi:hypothetical protein